MSANDNDNEWLIALVPLKRQSNRISHRSRFRKHGLHRGQAHLLHLIGKNSGPLLQDQAVNLDFSLSMSENRPEWNPAGLYKKQPNKLRFFGL